MKAIFSWQYTNRSQPNHPIKMILNSYSELENSTRQRVLYASDEKGLQVYKLHYTQTRSIYIQLEQNSNGVRRRTRNHQYCICRIISTLSSAVLPTQVPVGSKQAWSVGSNLEVKLYQRATMFQMSGPTRVIRCGYTNLGFPH